MKGTTACCFGGGDLDDQLRPINDHVALRFNRLLQRYEVAALRWDTANQRFLPAADDPPGAGFEKGWHFYTTVDVERTEFDLGAGDDEFRADGGYVFPNDRSGQAWGILEGDRQAGGGLTKLIVDGGPGNDQLYGGPGILDPSVSDFADQPVTEILLSDGIIDSGDGNVASIGPAGDVDGDGSDDLIISIENQEGAGTFYIVFGGTDRPGFLSSIEPAEPRAVRVGRFDDPERFHRRVNARPVGDLTGDGRDEIAVVDGDGTYLYAGLSRAEWTAGPLGRSDADASYPLAAYRAAGLGDFDGDGIADFGTVSEDTLRIFFGAADGALSDLDSVSVSGNFTTSDLLASGPLFSPGIASAVISGRSVLVGTDTPWGSDTSYLVESRGRLAPRLVATNELLLRPVGDLTGDGLDEFASVGRKQVARMGDFTNDPEPPPRLRWVTHLSISDDAADREARLTDESPRPHVTLDFADAPFANETRFEPGTFAPIFASVGDLGAGRADAEPDGRLSDFNGDGLDDIWIGSESFNGLIGQFKAGAGRVHLIPGRQRSVSFQGDGSFPGDGDFEILVNRGDRLIDPQTGQPVVFVPPALRVGEQDRWFRFTTAGDGAAGDQIRIVSLPGPDVPETPVDALPRPTVRIDLISDDGRVLATNQTIVDLRNRTAESYWIRVHRDSANPTTAGLPFRLEIAPPSLGDSHRPSDRDRLFGGPGDDRLSGGAELDVLRGGSGSDLFLSEREERFDFENGIDRVDPGFNRPEEANHQRLGQPADSPIDIAAHFDRALWRPIAEAMGHPVTTNADSRSVLHRAWFASGLAQIETLDLSGIPATDLSGLTLMTNLRHLDLRSSLRTAIDLPVLPKLQQLILSGNPIERVSASELSTLPQLRTLVLDNTSLADLGGLVGVQIVDDRDGGYVEGGSWQSEASATADAWLDGYRFTKSGGSATWTVAAPVGEIVRLWATWPTLENESTTATTYQVFDGESLLATVPVFQSTPAGALDENAMFGGRPWESLGEFASTSGDLSIVLAGADGTVVAADAVRAEQVSSPALSLETISLLGSPLNDVSRDQLLGRLQATNPLEVVLTADPGYRSRCTALIWAVGNRTARSPSSKCSTKPTRVTEVSGAWVALSSTCSMPWGKCRYAP